MAARTVRHCISSGSASPRPSHFPEVEQSVVTQLLIALARSREPYNCSSHRFDSCSATRNMPPRVTSRTVRTHSTPTDRPTGPPSVCVSGPSSCCMVAVSATRTVVHANGPDTERIRPIHGSRDQSCSTFITAAYRIEWSNSRRSWCYTTRTTCTHKPILTKSTTCGSIAPLRAGRKLPRSTLDGATYTAGPLMYNIAPNRSPDNSLTIGSSASPHNAPATEPRIDIRVAPGSQ